ncbi:MAG: hypothetical protein EOP34_11795 [Rickettsiales bacterium]|nr:MAG: hypothetical protein EOP34_11795 [Rickettsiales bacterium]
MNCEIVIGEPWDYISPHGEKNLIKGILIESFEKNQFLFQANYELKFGDLNGNYLLLSNRGTPLNKIGMLQVNCRIIKTDVNYLKDINYLIQHSDFVAIGSIVLKDD